MSRPGHADPADSSDLHLDPVLNFYTEPFDRRVASGRYPIFFADPREHEGEVALAMVQFRRAKPVS